MEPLDKYVFFFSLALRLFVRTFLLLPYSQRIFNLLPAFLCVAWLQQTQTIFKKMETLERNDPKKNRRISAVFFETWFLRRDGWIHLRARFLYWRVLPSRIGESKKGHWATLLSRTSNTFSGARTGRHWAVKLLRKLWPVIYEKKELVNGTAQCCGIQLSSVDTAQTPGSCFPVKKRAPSLL